jgi:hypothetical protein
LQSLVRIVYNTTMSQPTDSSNSGESAKPVEVKAGRSTLSVVLKCLFGLFLLIVLAGLTAPMMIRGPHRSDQREAVSNARQIGLALFEFEEQFGKFPDASTVGKVRKQVETDLILGTKSSNDFFRQLLAAEIAQSETMFYARISGTRRPDGVFTGVEALKKGECGFTYLMGATKQSHPSRPLVVTPMIPGTDRFDPTRFDGKAVILKLDNSVSSMSIGNDGHVMIFGKNLLDPENPVWGTDKPVIMWPE